MNRAPPAIARMMIVGAQLETRKDRRMSGKDKAAKNTPPKPAGGKPRRPNGEELYDDGDMATPKPDFDEEELKEEEDKRM